MKPGVLLAAFLIAALPGLAGAAEVDSTNRIDKRQESQDRRIDKGVKSGDLTKEEAARLRKGQTEVNRTERKAAADKKITPEERARIEKMQDQQAREIRKQRTDKQAASAGSSRAAKAKQEAARLDTLVEAEEKKAMADGVISPAERVRLGELYNRDPQRYEHKLRSLSNERSSRD